MNENARLLILSVLAAVLTAMTLACVMVNPWVAAGIPPILYAIGYVIVAANGKNNPGPAPAGGKVVGPQAGQAELPGVPDAEPNADGEVTDDTEPNADGEVTDDAEPNADDTSEQLE